MDRRKFIRQTVAASAFAGAMVSFGGVGRVLANTTRNPDVPYDLVAVKDAMPDEMFKRAMKLMGGMGKYVKPGQNVVVKPNIGWDVVPELAANTNPKLVEEIVKQCFEAGASAVYVFDNTCDKWNKCYSNSGIEPAAKRAGAKVVPGHSERYYQDVEVPQGKTLTSTKVHERILEADVFINVPILKHHGSTQLTISMKNLMGIVWNRHWWHRNDLHQCIADFATYRKPDLNIIDAYNVLMKNGPRGVGKADVSQKKFLVVSDDMVAADAAAAKIYGKTPSDVRYINLADEMAVGEMDLEKLNIKRIIMNQ